MNQHRHRLWIGHFVAMRRTRRLWTSLTVAGALVPASGALSTPEPSLNDTSLTATDSGARSLGPIRLAEGGEGGEGGEAGVDAARAATDPVAYLTGLDVIRAHFIAGLAAYQAGQAQQGADMFGHGIGEAYIDLEPVFGALGVPPFRDRLDAASDLALAGAPPADVAATVQDVYAALDSAETKAPGGNSAVTQAMVFADMLDRAALLYVSVARGDEGDAYIDGYGFSQVAKERSGPVLQALDQSQPEAAAAARAAIAALSGAFASVEKPAAIRIDPGVLLAATSKLRLALSARQG
jgi:hypothetical protein